MVAVRLVLLLTVLLWWVAALFRVMTGTVRVVNSPVELIVKAVDGPVEKKTDVSFTQHDVFSDAFQK